MKSTITTNCNRTFIFQILIYFLASIWTAFHGSIQFAVFRILIFTRCGISRCIFHFRKERNCYQNIDRLNFVKRMVWNELIVSLRILTICLRRWAATFNMWQCEHYEEKRSQKCYLQHDSSTSCIYRSFFSSKFDVLRLS